MLTYYSAGYDLQSGRYQSAADKFEKLVASGNTIAGYSLAIMLMEGRLGPPDYSRARELLEWVTSETPRTAPEAFRALGFMYLDGLGVNRDLEMAAHWFRRGADNGDTSCKEELLKL